MAKKKSKSKHKEPPRAKVGRYWYVKGYDDKPIIGLSWDSGNGYYFPMHFKQAEEYKKTNKRTHFGKDYDIAIGEFRSGLAHFKLEYKYTVDGEKYACKHKVSLDYNPSNSSELIEYISQVFSVDSRRKARSRCRPTCKTSTRSAFSTRYFLSFVTTSILSME